MRKVVIASVTAAGLAFAGPALANCEDELADAQADLDAAADVDEADRSRAAALLADAEASLAAGEEDACLDSVTEARGIIGEEPPRSDAE